ncbi:MAG TPA: hypothetical protein VMW36_05260 [Patescibacteria group bacterium]|nr:hypothetical protein [Patescibacteria group bacterium]
MSIQKALRLMLSGMVSDQDRMAPPPDEWIEALELLDSMDRVQESMVHMPTDDQQSHYAWVEEQYGEGVARREQDHRRAVVQAANAQAERDEIRRDLVASRSLISDILSGEFGLEELEELEEL